MASGQVPVSGVNVKDITAWVRELTGAATNWISPVPEAGRPMPGLLFVQEAEVPGPVSGRKIVSPEHTATSGSGGNAPLGVTVRLNACASPMHPPNSGATVIWAVCGALTGAATKLRLPTPCAGKPMVGLSFVQVKLAFDVPEKRIATDSPAQTVTLSIGSITGVGRTSISKVVDGPLHEPITGVTVTTLTSGAPTLAGVKTMAFPLPEAAKPVAVLSFVQINDAPGEPLRAMFWA